jgi:hypothetical protein
MVIGVDPGESTGAFIIDLYPSRIDPPYVIEASWRAQGPPGEVLASLTTELEAARLNGVHAVLAVERFTVMPATSRMTQQSTPQQVIGQLQMLADEYGATFLLQAPGDAKKFCPNMKLHQFGFRSTGKMVSRPDANDVNDAARHAVLALARTRATAYEALLRRSIPAQR